MVFALQHRFLRGVAVLALCVATGGPVLADSFFDALTAAYRTNPSLQGERARQRQTDELETQAKAGWRPVVSAEASIAKTYEDNNLLPHTEATPKRLSIQLNQPLFRGFKTVEGTKQARATIKAGRQALLSVEQNVLLDAATAYLDVLRDRQILGLRERNVTNLQRQASAASARFDAGEVTRTDVSQSRARVSGARAQVAVARSNLGASIARYKAVIGKAPPKKMSAKRAKTPSSLDDALAIARQTNPNILAASHSQVAATHAIEVTKGDLLPQASLQAQASVSYPGTGGLIDRTSSVSIAGVVTVPIYEGGRVYSSVRQAKHLESQRRIDVVGATRGVTQAVTQAWNFTVAAREAIAAANDQVSAAGQALEGVRQEYLVGSRSTVDVLNAEQELVNAKISLVSAEHDHIVATYQLKASIGRLTARQIGLAGPYYDAEENYNNVKNKWIGLDADTIE
jgi:outer membrane protein